MITLCFHLEKDINILSVKRIKNARIHENNINQGWDMKIAQRGRSSV